MGDEEFKDFVSRWTYHSTGTASTDYITYLPYSVDECTNRLMALEDKIEKREKYNPEVIDQDCCNLMFECEKP